MNPAKYFDWDEAKNESLKQGRGVGFEDVLTAIRAGGILAVEKHHNQKQYPGQKMYIVNINNYAYMVPFVEDEKKYFLKTLYPSRKMTLKYLIKRRKT